MRILLIANAVASSYSARRRVVIRKALAADNDLEFVETEHRGHATELAAKAAAAGVDVVVVLAGDGTLNEAANGLVGTSTMLAPLPGGSTNVYAQTIGVPTDPVDAASVLIQRRRRGVDRRTDVERCVVLGREPVPHQVDGDDLGDAARLVITHVPDAITLVTPTTVEDPAT